MIKYWIVYLLLLILHYWRTVQCNCINFLDFSFFFFAVYESENKKYKSLAAQLLIMSSENGILLVEALYSFKGKNNDEVSSLFLFLVKKK